MTLAQVQEWIIARVRWLEAAARQERGICLMRRKAKPITRALVKKYFGKRANVYGFDGWYRITTPGGGLVRIGPGETAKIVYGGDDIYAAVVGLLGECWGELRAGGLGSREFLLGCIAHGEAQGVKVYPDFRDWKATVARWVVASLVAIGVGAALGPDSPDGSAHGIIAFLAWVVVFFLMKRAAKREEQHKLVTGGFHYPRGASGAGFADEDEDQLRKGGLI